jgi:hypothetical protein
MLFLPLVKWMGGRGFLRRYWEGVLLVDLLSAAIGGGGLCEDEERGRCGGEKEGGELHVLRQGSVQFRDLLFICCLLVQIGRMFPVRRNSSIVGRMISM